MDELTQARAERDAGMRRAVEHTESVTPKWGDGAYRFLCWFAATSRICGLKFTSEDVATLYADFMHPAPASPRAWGAVYVRAVRNGVIKQVGVGRSKKRHASICPLWAAGDEK